MLDSREHKAATISTREVLPGACAIMKFGLGVTGDLSTNRIPITSQKAKMIGRPFPTGRTMSASIARHRRTRQARFAACKPAFSAWKLVLFPKLFFFRWRERRALSNLILLAPANAEEACQKLVYLMAAMVADPAGPGATGIANAIKTLKPFGRTLVHCLSKRRTPFK